ncbi:MAG: hypothetical protein LBC50_01440 [Candidatus Ancillula sp.]|nr:hypothetical protein [Candidatus Ancillula sp.]
MRTLKRHVMRTGATIAAIALAVVTLQFVEIGRSQDAKALATPSIDVEQRVYTQFQDDGNVRLKVLYGGENESVPDNTMGRGLNIEKYGTRLNPDAVIKGTGTAKTLDVGNNPCLWYSRQTGTSQWLELSQSDTKKEWSRKYSVGIEGGYGQGKPRPSVEQLTYNPSEGTTKFMPQYAADYMGLAPGSAGSVSGSVSHGSTSGWTTGQRHYEGRVYSASENDTIQYDPHMIPTSNDTCSPIVGLSEEDVLTRLTTDNFKTDVLNKLPADEFLDRYGDLIVTSGSFGSTSSVFADFNSRTEQKSDKVDAQVKGSIKGITGGMTGSYENDRKIIENDGSIDSYSYGGFAPPNWGIDKTLTQNAEAANKWFNDSTTAAKNLRQFIGGAVKNSAEGARTNLDDIGKWVWEFIDSKMLAPSNVRYPSVAECNAQFGNNQELKDDCLSRAGQVMTYADWIHTRYRTRLIERGGMVGDELSKGPYVKNVYTSGDGIKLLGSYSIGTAKANLHKMMQDDCDKSVDCVYFDDYGNGRQSLTSHAYTTDGWKWAGPILLGYSLTNDPREALVNFDVIAGDSTRVHDCVRDTDVLYSKNGTDERGYRNGGYHYADNGWMQKNELPVNFITCSHPKQGTADQESKDPYGYWFSQDLNRHAGGKFIYFANRMRYNPNYPSYIDGDGHAHNVPITAIGLENAATDSDHHGLWPGEDGELPGASQSSAKLTGGAAQLSTGKLIPSNHTIWTKLNQNLNEGTLEGNPMYLYLGH